ncbi:hypothetical protein BMR07_07985 [Methylococcaceae bacterium CS1]|nr:hypothetical protein BMR07_07985 [Methylococcaceae bacterium CS1]
MLIIRLYAFHHQIGFIRKNDSPDCLIFSVEKLKKRFSCNSRLLNKAIIQYLKMQAYVAQNPPI